jgi:hypothetical protein
MQWRWKFVEHGFMGDFPARPVYDWQVRIQELQDDSARRVVKELATLLQNTEAYVLARLAVCEDEQRRKAEGL